LKIELYLSEEFHRSKRNVLLTCSITIVLAIAQADPIKVPGLGVDSSLPARTVFCLLLLANIYMALAFYVDFQAMRARNSEAAAEGGTQRIDEKIKQGSDYVSKRAGELAALIDQAGRHVASSSSANMDESINAALDQVTAAAAAGLSALTGSQMPAPGGRGGMSQAISNMQQAVESLKSARGRIVSKAGVEININKNLDLVRNGIDSYSNEMASIAQKFGRLSDSIGATQRRGFEFLQGWVPAAFSLFSIGSCIRYILSF